jgi:hypothetical protein
MGSKGNTVQKTMEFPTEWVIVNQDEGEQQKTPNASQPMNENLPEALQARAAASAPSNAA